MHSVWDWTTLSLFCGLAIVFLSRSIGSMVAGDRAISYLPPALGYAIANQLGNAGWPWTAGFMLLSMTAYVVIVIKPWVRA